MPVVCHWKTYITVTCQTGTYSSMAFWILSSNAYIHFVMTIYWPKFEYLKDSQHGHKILPVHWRFGHFWSGQVGFSRHLMCCWKLSLFFLQKAFSCPQVSHSACLLHVPWSAQSRQETYSIVHFGGNGERITAVYSNIRNTSNAVLVLKAFYLIEEVIIES